MNGKLTDEAYARAALTYLAEPTDRWLVQLLRVHGAAVTLAAIKSGRLLGTGELAGHAAGQGTAPASRAGGRARRSRPPWSDGVLGCPSCRHRSRCSPSVSQASGSCARVTRNGRGNWRTSGMTSPTPYGCAAMRTCGSAAFGRSRSLAREPPPPTARYVAAEFAASVAARGLAVVSGGAFGVDAAAHRGALGADGVTVAVLACGVDVPYPTAHAELFDAIAAQGVLVSEWPPGQHVSRLRFLVRNRVIAALATGHAGGGGGPAQRGGQYRAACQGPAPSPDGGPRADHRPTCPPAATRSLGSGRARSSPARPRSSSSCPRSGSRWPGSRWPGSRWPGSRWPGSRRPASAAGEPGTVVPLASRQAPLVLPRDLLDLESARVLDAMPRRGGAGTVRVAQRAGLAPATTATLLGQLATGGFIERCDDGWRLPALNTAPRARRRQRRQGGETVEWSFPSRPPGVHTLPMAAAPGRDDPSHPAATPATATPATATPPTATPARDGPAGGLPAALSTALAEFCRHLAAERALSRHTVRAYQGDVQSLLEYACRSGVDDPGSLDLATLRGWLAGQHQAGAARATLARRGAAARAFTGYAEKRGWLAANPGPQLGTPKARRVLPQVLHREEMSLVLAECEDRVQHESAAGERAAAALAMRDAALLELLYATAIRVSELCELDAGGLDRERRTVRVLGKGRKERVVPVGVPAMRALARWEAAGRPLLANERSGPRCSSAPAVVGSTQGPHAASCTTCCGTQGRTPSGIPRLRTCSRGAPTCAACRRSSATPPRPPRRFTRMSRLSA